MNEPQRDSDPPPTGGGSLLARHPWILVVAALALFVTGSIVALMVAIAHPPVLLR